MRSTRARSVILAIVGVLAAAEATAFGTQRAHEELVRAALRIASHTDVFQQHLDLLELHRGVDHALALQISLVPELDPQVADKRVDDGPVPYYEGRLNKSQSAMEKVDGEWVRFPDAPKTVFYRIPGACPKPPDFDACYENLERVSVAQLIRIGVRRGQPESPLEAPLP